MVRTVPLRIVLVALVTMLIGSGCAKDDPTRDDLRAILDRTSVLSHRFVFTQRDNTREVVVRGMVEDDFRFKARVTLDGDDVLDQVVSDDAMALRFLDPSVLPNFIVERDTDEPSTVESLALSRWVLDDDGAPPLGAAAVEDRVRGADPVVDALTMFEYVELAMADAGDVSVFNPESIYYRADEDPFPHPDEASGIERYDILPKGFPNASERGPDGAPLFPSVAQFRKMAVYVRDGVVIQVRERIAAEGRVLEDLEGFVRRLVGEQSPRLLDQFDDDVAQLPDDGALAEYLLGFLNIGLQQAGREVVTFRSMAFELVNIGQSLEVALPTDVVEGDLGFVGVKEQAPDRGGSGDVASDDSDVVDGTSDPREGSTDQ